VVSLLSSLLLKCRGTGNPPYPYLLEMLVQTWKAATCCVTIQPSAVHKKSPSMTFSNNCIGLAMSLTTILKELSFQ